MNFLEIIKTNLADPKSLSVLNFKTNLAGLKALYVLNLLRFNNLELKSFDP